MSKERTGNRNMNVREEQFMKREILHNFIKHVVVGIFTLVVFVIGACILPSEGSEALAAEAYTADSYAGTEVSSTYWTKTAPEPKDTKYAGWLFAGWMDTEGNVATSIDTSATYYAKFVDPEVLSVKVQVTDGVTATSDHERANMRLVSSIDSLDYNGAGFEVYYNNNIDDYGEAVETVYKRIEAGSTSGVAFKYSPKVIDTDSEHFMTYTLLGIKRGNFENIFHIRPYWITKDGLKIHGVSRFVKVSDSYSNVTNIPVYADSVEVVNGYESATVGITSGEAAIAGVSVAQDGYYYDSATKWANLRVTITGVDALPSASTISATIGDNTYKVIYRNLEKEYVGTAKSYVVGDQTWYSEYILNNPDETAFVIATTTDLYGLPDLVNDSSEGNSFAGMQIYVVADIQANTGVSVSPNTSTGGNPALSSSADYRWEPIGNADVKFSGKFDGCGHTISGLYMNCNKYVYNGFFGLTDNAEITNIRLVDSVFRSSLGDATSKFDKSVYVGSIVAWGDATISNVYSNATLVGFYYMGGLIGYVGDDNANDCIVKINHCQYDGLVYNRSKSTDSYTSGESTVTRSDCNVRSGGIIGYLTKGKLVEINNTLYSGDIRVSDGANRFGGFVGDTNASSNLKDFKILNSISAGKITLISDTVTSNCIGSVIGRVHAQGNISLDNVYATNECYEISCAVNGLDTLNLVDGKDATKVSYSDLIGLSAYHKINLDFVNDWAPVEGALIAPRAIAQNPYTITENETKADTTWYNAEEGKTEYEIASADQLYGLAILVNDGNTFESITIKLTADIDLNPGQDGKFEVKDSNLKEMDELVNEWIPIGTESNPFKGIFDGNNKTIRGLYIDKSVNDGENAGLFGYIDAAIIRDVGLVDGYIHVSGIRSVTGDATKDSATGSVIGRGYGTLEGVYSNVGIYAVNSARIGGLVGVADNVNATKSNSISLNNCWYDGDMAFRVSKANASELNAGGLIGYVLRGTSTTISHVLFSGQIDYKNVGAYSEATTVDVRIGGFIGRDNGTLTKITISDSIMAGDMIIQANASEYVTNNYVASILGRCSGTLVVEAGSAVYSMNNTYGAVVLTDTNTSTNVDTITQNVVVIVDWDGAIESLDSEYWAPTATIPVLRNLTQYTTYQVLP